ncbi:DegV family protein [Agrilactobacillus fermenti]|uniref:DegV family protein n=1 Tax=Agrilactobacillus fermenti TaxID=2586909 RepID=UPI001E3AB506|nr:DegV family protein [Agrilactobacillus fermenti]MCD2256575.1 DegV family protein [Agrilactobacillus fermenti]
MKLAIVTDSTAYLSDELIKAYGIHIIPIPFIVNGKQYQEGVDISTSEFYHLLKTSSTFPSTSQPPLGKVAALYHELAQAGYDTVLSIHLASTISGFVNNLQMLAEETKEIKIIPYDSQITVMLMGSLVLEAAKLAQKGIALDRIIARLDEMRQTMNEVFIVNDLQNLVRGGRLSNAGAFVGTMLKIKPLLTFDDQTHKIVAFDKVRSIKRAYKHTESIFSDALAKVDYPIQAFIIHGDDLSEAQRWQTDLQQKFPQVSFQISYFGPVVGTHLGDKAIALAWIRKYPD